MAKGASLVVAKEQTDGGAGQLRVLGTHRSAFHPDDDLEQQDPQPARPRKRFRLAVRIAMILGAVILVFVAGIGLLFVLTPSAGWSGRRPPGSRATPTAAEAPSTSSWPRTCTPQARAASRRSSSR